MRVGIFELRPDLIIETGTCRGGSALYIASLFDLVDHGKIVTIDIEEKESRPKHERITGITGSSTADDTLQKLDQELNGCSSVMVILDSDHKKDHVLKECGHLQQARNSRELSHRGGHQRQRASSSPRSWTRPDGGRRRIPGDEQGIRGRHGERKAPADLQPERLPAESGITLVCESSRDSSKTRHCASNRAGAERNAAFDTTRTTGSQEPPAIYAGRQVPDRQVDRDPFERTTEIG